MISNSREVEGARARRLLKVAVGKVENMDGVSPKVTFRFSEVTSDGGPVNMPWEVYLRIVGSFSIVVGERILYTEELFCIVEFAVKSNLWLKRVNEIKEDFVYTSQESEDTHLFWIRKSGAGWRIGSMSQEYEESRTFALDLLTAALSEYFNRLQNAVTEKFGKNIVDVLTWAVKRECRDLRR